ncbi:MAG: ester cyclase [Actinomycetota bacterium]
MGSAADHHRAAHAAFNKRDWDASKGLAAEDLVYEDRGRGVTLKGQDQFVDWLKGWATGLSDARPDEPTYIDGGEYSVALFKGRGTHDGQLGPLPASGRRMDLPFCEVLHWNSDGKMTRGEIYYDQMTLMVQLGAMEPPPAG